MVKSQHAESVVSLVRGSLCELSYEREVQAEGRRLNVVGRVLQYFSRLTKRTGNVLERRIREAFFPKMSATALQKAIAMDVHGTYWAEFKNELYSGRSVNLPEIGQFDYDVQSGLEFRPTATVLQPPADARPTNGTQIMERFTNNAVCQEVASVAATTQLTEDEQRRFAEQLYDRYAEHLVGMLGAHCSVDLEDVGSYSWARGAMTFTPLPHVLRTLGYQHGDRTDTK